VKRGKRRLKAVKEFLLWRRKTADLRKASRLSAGWAVNLASYGLAEVSKDSPIRWYLDITYDMFTAGQERLLGPTEKLPP